MTGPRRAPEPPSREGARIRRHGAGLLLLLAALTTLTACAARSAREAAPESEGIAFTRPDPDGLPGDLRQWVRENSRRRGTHVRHEGERTYLLVAWGEKPTGGYAVRVEDLARGRQAEVAVVRLEAPQPGQPVTQAITYPYDLVSAPRLRRPVVFAYRGDLTLTSPLPPRDEAAGPAQESGNFRVTSPRPGETIESPVRIVGKARAFEATFDIEIEDGHNVLARQTVRARDAAPAWGEFEVSVPFERPTSPAGAIIFVTYSPADGSRREELILPVRFRVP